MDRRTKWLLAAVYLLAASLPLLCLGALGSGELLTWLKTGMCPAGPMDRPARLCSPAELFFIVFLGGWASFLVLPVLVLWEAGALAAVIGALAYLRFRMKAYNPRGPAAGDPDNC